MTASRVSLAGILSRLIHTARVLPDQADVSDEEVEAWVDAAALEYFSEQDQEFVERALALGIDSGMVLDVGSQLGLIPLKILWQKDDLFGIGLQRLGKIAERARETADAWELGERMFFQVGDPHQMKFKSDYFDLMVSDAALHRFVNPLEVLVEINRVTKPSGAILIRDLLRPSSLRLSRHLADHGRHYTGRLRSAFEASVRAGFTRRELNDLVGAARLRARVSSDRTHVFIERRGSNDPSSWIAEREKYF